MATRGAVWGALFIWFSASATAPAAPAKASSTRSRSTRTPSSHPPTTTSRWVWVGAPWVRVWEPPRSGERAMHVMADGSRAVPWRIRRKRLTAGPGRVLRRKKEKKSETEHDGGKAAMAG